MITPNPNVGSAEGEEQDPKVLAEQLFAVEVHEKLEKAKKYAKRLGVAPSEGVKEPKGQAFINGRHFYINEVSTGCVHQSAKAETERDRFLIAARRHFCPRYRKNSTKTYSSSSSR